MAKTNHEQKRQHAKRQASLFISLTGIVVFGIVVCVSLITQQPIPIYVICVFVSIIVPPELVKRLLRALIGGHDD